MLAFLAGEAAGMAWLEFGGIATLRSYGIDASRAPPGAAQYPALGRKAGRAAAGKPPRLPGRPFHHRDDRRLSVRPCRPEAGPFDRGADRPRPRLDPGRVPALAETRFAKKVVHGHTPVPRPDFRDNRINLDTGAYATGKLTAAVFEDEFVTLL